MSKRIGFALISVALFMLLQQCTVKENKAEVNIAKKSIIEDSDSLKIFINSFPNSLFSQDSFGELIELDSGKNSVLRGAILIDSKNNIMFPIYHDSLTFKLINNKWVVFHKNPIIADAVSFDSELKKISPSRFKGVKEYSEFSNEIYKSTKQVKLLLGQSAIVDTLQVYNQFWLHKFQADLYRNLLFYLKKEVRNINSSDINSLKVLLSKFYSGQTFLNVNEYKRGAFYYLLLLEGFDRNTTPDERLKNIETNLQSELKDAMLVHYINNFEVFFPKVTVSVKESLKSEAKRGISMNSYLSLIAEEINLNYKEIANNTDFLDDNNQVVEFSGRLSKKISYVDIWASWCMPCLQEMTYSKSLKKEYEKQDIDFIYVSIDEDYTKWHKSNSKLNLGYHSYFSTFFKDKLAIKSIPRYLIIDKSGKVINADAPRPSDPNIKEVFDSILKVQ